MVRQKGGTIMGACQIATQACHFRPEGAHRHGGRRLTIALGQHGQHQRLNPLVSRALWIFTRQRTYLQQAHGKRRQQTQQADQAVNGLQLSFLNATAAFQTLVIVLDEPPTLIPVYTTQHAPTLVQACWWAPRSSKAIPAAPHPRELALPKRE